MASKSKTTSNHDEIRQWAEERGGKPSHVASTGNGGDIGVVRIEFPGATGSQDANLTEISWDEFFEKFDEHKLALVYQEETAVGEKSNFNKIVSAGTAGGARPRKAQEKSSRPPVKVVKKAAGVSRPAAKKAPAKKAAVKKVAKKTAPAKKKTAFTKKAVARPVKKATTTKKQPLKKRFAAARKGVAGRKRR